MSLLNQSKKLIKVLLCLLPFIAFNTFAQGWQSNYSNDELRGLKLVDTVILGLKESNQSYRERVSISIFKGRSLETQTRRLITTSSNGITKTTDYKINNYEVLVTLNRDSSDLAVTINTSYLELLDKKIAKMDAKTAKYAGLIVAFYVSLEMLAYLAPYLGSTVTNTATGFITADLTAYFTLDTGLSLSNFEWIVKNNQGLKDYLDSLILRSLNK